MPAYKPLAFLIAGLLMLGTLPGVRAADTFADPLFAQRWQQDETVVPNFWGPLATAGAGQYESYLFAAACPQQPPGMPRPCDPPAIFTRRIVQYFDKERMELKDESSPHASVTAGLLVTEMMTGKVQTGDTRFDQQTPAAVPVAGDTSNTFPLYRDLPTSPAATQAATVGAPVQLLLTPQGSSTIAAPSDAGAVIASVDGATGHGVAQAFADFRAHVGLDNVGLALTEPFWADVAIAGQQRRILIQPFERRVLTYNPANPAQFRVEFGNVGQQYYRWRYSSDLATQATRTVTLADDGQVVTLAHGTSFLLALGSDNDWKVQVGDETVVSRVPNISVITGAQGVYAAKQPGQTTLTASGDPVCRTAQPPCGAPSRAFRVQIVVT
ncbi:MAG TPA: hypothetical protein VIC60_00150 [Thermomicrobiales bacterium]